jgi:hypothetical protein
VRRGSGGVSVGAWAQGAGARARVAGAGAGRTAGGGGSRAEARGAGERLGWRERQQARAHVARAAPSGAEWLAGRRVSRRRCRRVSDTQAQGSGLATTGASFP